jgi:peptidoglycan/LPS O-acetylase OafA/YrhL
MELDVESPATLMKIRTQERISVIEALRAFACLGVALFHFCNQLSFPGAGLAAGYGWLGVDVFFVISGYVIPLSLYGRGYTLSDFPSFLLRRLIRLEPPYLASIAIVIGLWYASSVTPGFRGVSPNLSALQVASHLFYVIPLTNYQWLNPVYWSLAYEFVFYLTVGLTFSYLIEWNVAATVALGLGALGLSFAIYGTADVRILEFLVGALVMRLTVSYQDVTTAVCLGAVLLLVLIVGGIATVIVVCSAAAAILFFRSVQFGDWAVFLGGMSYSLYLVHVPVGGRVINLLKRFGHNPLYDFGIAALALIVSLLAAMLLHYFIEAPAMLASRRINGYRLFGHRKKRG